MEKENSQKCCGSFGSKHKRVCIAGIIVVAVAIILLALASVAWKMHQARNGMLGNYSRCGRMMNFDGQGCSGVVPPQDQFVAPQDALKSGELAIVVSDLESAKKAVSEISSQNAGSVYATFIAYASNNVKNGSIVVQIPAANFDQAFEALKKVGNQVVQESTQQIAPNNFYYPMAAQGNASVESAPASDAKPEIAIAPKPVQSQLVQDKGYIKVIFVDYGAGTKNVSKIENKVENKIAGANIFNIGNPSQQDLKNNLFVVVAVKLIFLIAILGLLIAVFKKIFHRIRRKKENVTKVHVVRQAPKTQKRVVKIQKTAKKIQKRK